MAFSGIQGETPLRLTPSNIGYGEVAPTTTTQSTGNVEKLKLDYEAAKKATKLAQDEETILRRKSRSLLYNPSKITGGVEARKKLTDARKLEIDALMALKKEGVDPELGCLKGGRHSRKGTRRARKGTRRH